MTVSPTPDKNLMRRMQLLEQRIAQLEKRLQRPTLAGLHNSLIVRLAITIEAPGVPYPLNEEGDKQNTFRIAFTDSHFTAAQGNQAVTNNKRNSSTQAWQQFGRTLDGSWLPKDTLCAAIYQPPLDATKGYWWLIPMRIRGWFSRQASGTSGVLSGDVIPLSAAGIEHNATYNAVPQDITLDLRGYWFIVATATVWAEAATARGTILRMDLQRWNGSVWANTNHHAYRKQDIEMDNYGSNIFTSEENIALTAVVNVENTWKLRLINGGSTSANFSAVTFAGTYLG